MTAGKFLDEKSIEKNRRERREAMEEKKRREDAGRAWSWVALIGADTGLVTMILMDLIHPVIGVAALAVVSAVLGRGTK